MFSFNSPFGACESCNGLGIRMEFDPDLIIPDKELCIADGAVALYRNAIDGWRGQHLAAVAKHFGFDVFTPMKDLTEEQYNALMYGSDERIQFSMSMKNGDAYWSHNGQWEGLDTAEHPPLRPDQFRLPAGGAGEVHARPSLPGLSAESG